ncbi:MAG: hypothetical protein ABSG84_14315 [Acidobacteriaceae bacterium]|jgi:hypothetical protein
MSKSKRPQTITAAQFLEAMSHLKRPSESVRKLLRAHFNSKGRVSTMTLLAEAAGYASFSPANLHYGGLARRIGRHLAISEPSVRVPTASDAYLSLIGDFIPPEEVTNAHWLLVMKPEFAEALLASGWID